MGKNFNNNRNNDNRGNNHKNGYNGSRRNNNFDPALKALKEAKARELEEKRTNDYHLLDLVCEILNDRVYTVLNLKAAGEINRENSKIGMVDIHNYYAESDLGEFPSKNNISFLINILIDLARAQTNSRVQNCQIAAKILYFYDRFISHFSNKFADPSDLLNKYEYLFDTAGIKKIIFEHVDENVDPIVFRFYMDDEDEEITEVESKETCEETVEVEANKKCEEVTEVETTNENCEETAE